MFYVAMVAGITAGVITLLKRGIIGSLGSSAASMIIAIIGIVLLFGSIISVNVVIELASGLTSYSAYPLFVYFIFLFYLASFVFQAISFPDRSFGEGTRGIIWVALLPLANFVGLLELLFDFSANSAVFFMLIVGINAYVVVSGRTKMEAWGIISPVLKEVIQKEVEELEPPILDDEEMARIEGKPEGSLPDLSSEEREAIRQKRIREQTTEWLYELYPRMVPNLDAAERIIKRFGDKDTANKNQAEELNDPSGRR